jgi:tetratricopeptide (TPR) repeat protein
VYPNLATRGVRSDILANALTNWREKDWEKAPSFDIVGRDRQWSLPNPFHSLLFDLHEHTGQVIRSRIHGDLNLTNVIVSLRSDRNIDETFVIDLANSQPNRVLAVDFARLEAEIWRNVFTWSQPEDPSSSQYTLLEEFVGIREFLDGMVETLPTRLSKRAWGCAVLVDELRRIAKAHLKTDTAYLLGDYMECLCFTSLELLKHYDVFSSTTTSRVLILSAALCRQFLNDVRRGYFINKSNVSRWRPPRSLNVTASKLRTERDIGGQDFERHSAQNVEARRMARFHLGGIPPRRRLFGRTDELQIIDRQLVEHGITVLSIYAEGGAGKSQLVHDWLWRKAQSNKKTEVFCFSFNSQGTSEKRQTPSADFFRELFGWLGLKAKGHLTSEQRIEELASVILDRRLILYLDGIEPLQDDPGDGGAPLKDQAVRDFLDRLAVSGSHFIIITTRYRIKNLAPSRHLEQIELPELSTDAAVQLLKTEHKVWGEDEAQLNEAVTKWRCHALTIDLLGSYLRTYCAGDIRGSDTIRKRYKATNGHYWSTQMLRAYDAQLESSDKQLLRLLGLFDRPVEEEILWKLNARPIPHINDELTELDFNQRRLAIKRLADLRLLHTNQLNNSSEIQIDCHALIRHYQAERLQEESPKGWKAANVFLSHYFSGRAERQKPRSAIEIKMLYRALVHGCAAGRFSTSFKEIYWKRISHKTEYFSTGQLGFFAEDLEALASFFASPWSVIVPGLPVKEKAEIFGLAGFRLMILGRLNDAREAMEHALKCFETLKHKGREGASNQASNLAVLHRMQGRLNDAIELGHRALEYATSPRQVLLRIAVLAEFCHYADRLDEALGLFTQAEGQQATLEPKRPLLYSTLGFRYCELLLTLGNAKEVVERARYMRKHVTSKSALLDRALSYLCEGRAYLQLLHKSEPSLLEHSERLIRRADNLVKRSQHRDNQIRTSVALAECLRLQNRAREALRIIKRAGEVASLYGMWLHKLDCEFQELLIQAALSSRTPDRSAMTNLAKRAVNKGYNLLAARIKML